MLERRRFQLDVVCCHPGCTAEASLGAIIMDFAKPGVWRCHMHRVGSEEQP